MSEEAINVNIFRYKFTPEFMNQLYEFAKIHQYDDRKAFKEAWVDWKEENEESMKREISRLGNLGYDGNIEDKAFKSARYYFRKKPTVKREPKERCKYISVSKNFIIEVDNHIERNMSNPDYKPSSGFSNFCQTNTELLKDEIINLNNMVDGSDMFRKIKKTYKNRYFIMTTKDA